MNEKIRQGQKYIDENHTPEIIGKQWIDLENKVGKVGFQMKRILLTGGAGFIAHHTIRHLLQNTDWEIVSLDSQITLAI